MRIVSRETWLAEREVLLGQEKRRRRASSMPWRKRQALPCVAVEADYTFSLK